MSSFNETTLKCVYKRLEPRNGSRNNLLSSSLCPELSVRKSCIVIVFKAGPVFQFCLTVFFLWHGLVLKKLRDYHFEPQKARNILDRICPTDWLVFKKLLETKLSPSQIPCSLVRYISVLCIKLRKLSNGSLKIDSPISKSCCDHAKGNISNKRSDFNKLLSGFWA